MWQYKQQMRRKKGNKCRRIILITINKGGTHTAKEAMCASPVSKSAMHICIYVYVLSINMYKYVYMTFFCVFE